MVEYKDKIARIEKQDLPGRDFLLKAIHAVLTRADEDYVLEQVKEKFGSLRYYYRFSKPLPDDYRKSVMDIVVTLSDMAPYYCQQCGAVSQISEKNGWLTTRCGKCS